MERLPTYPLTVQIHLELFFMDILTVIIKIGIIATS